MGLTTKRSTPDLTRANKNKQKQKQKKIRLKMTKIK